MPSDSTQNHKFKDLKVFGSTEWLANNEKNYRLVYDESECSYIYAELSFYNKLFDESEWEVKIQLKCFDPKGTELCNLNCDRIVKKEDNIVYVREGWGMKNRGVYWKRGIYRWEAWIEGKKVFERPFYIEKEGLVNQLENPYFGIESLKLYEGPDANLPQAERIYLSAFSSEESRYVWLEFQAANLLNKYESWACELIFNFRTDTGQLKGSVDKLLIIKETDEKIQTTVGWGSDIKGTWYLGAYSVELVFMDQIIAVLPFSVGDEMVPAIEDEILFLTPFPHQAITPEPQPNIVEEKTLDQLMLELEALIGLKSIKKKVRDYTSYLNFLSLRRDKGFADNERISLHAVFTGNPGTGKTTVAKMLGKIYHKMGLLSKGDVTEVDRADLVAEFIGQTAPKVKEAIANAKGGILFIDEAYALARKSDDAKDFGKEAIEVLLKEMSDGDGDIAIIVAGYPAEMEFFLESNPGLRSRFNITFEFPDYLPEELEQIALFTAEKRGVKFSPEALEYLRKKLMNAYRERSQTFGNARFVNSVIDEAKMNMGLRLMGREHPEELTTEELSVFDKADIELIFKSRERIFADIPIDEDLLRESMSQLKTMVGMDDIKTEIDELVKLVRYYRETGKDIRQSFSLHSIFTGNPGTGKTTVARILARIYKALGILERGQLIEVDRQGLVGGYIGQTALKTKEVIDKAIGGVLFIDEAYSLLGGSQDYGKEVIETLLKRMEDQRGEFIVIAAGYTEEMQAFMDSNPGLKSRFDRVFQFNDYQGAELLLIATKMLKDNNLILAEESMMLLRNYLNQTAEHKDKYFANGRAVRKIVEEIIKRQNLRLASMEPNARTPELIECVIADDLKDVFPGPGSQKPSIGFRLNT